jgi:hypothetical protein
MKTLIQSNSNNLEETPKIDRRFLVFTSISVHLLSQHYFIWPSYIGEKGRTFGQTIWDKGGVLLGTPLKNTLRTGEHVGTQKIKHFYPPSPYLSRTGEANGCCMNYGCILDTVK